MLTLTCTRTHTHTHTHTCTHTHTHTHTHTLIHTGKIVLKSTEVSVTSKLSTNGRLFVLHMSTAETRKMVQSLCMHVHTPKSKQKSHVCCILAALNLVSVCVWLLTASLLMQPELVLPEQNQPPVLPFPIESDVREIAAHLVVYDWNLFQNIQQVLTDCVCCETCVYIHVHACTCSTLVYHFS